MKKTIMNIAAVNVISWYNNDDTRAKLKKLPLTTQWTMRKNMRALEPLAKEFGDFRDELVQKRNEEWFVEGNGKCEKVTREVDGQEQELLQILPDLQEEFAQYEQELNVQLNEIMVEENEVEITPIDLEEFVEMADEYKTGIDMDDLDIISVFEKTDVEEVEAEIVEG